MSTYIDGIGSCQVIDKSGEIVELKGLDITSLAKTGTFTWEHKSDSPATLVGKILKAKKIFSEKDCESDRERYYWNKCKNPYLYVMGELLDEYTASARECAGQMKYSKEKSGQQPLLGFSIEGSEIPNTRQSKMIITRSIARKCTLTQSPCNSACVAEIFEAPEQKSEMRSELDEIFKSEANAIDMLKSDAGLKIYEDFLAKKEDAPFLTTVDSKAPKTFGQHAQNKGSKIGATKSGKDVHSHGKVGEYGFNSGEHKEAADLHRTAALSAGNAKLADNHIQRMKLHNQAALTAGHKEGRASMALAGKKSTALANAKGQKKVELRKDAPPAAPTPDMSVPPPEPNRANAAAMSAGAMSGGPSFSEAMSNLKSGLGFGKGEHCEMHKKDRLNEPVFNKVPSTKLRAGLPGIKEGMGSSHMGTHVRMGNKKNANKEHHAERAKEIAGKNLKQLKDSPKPDLGKSDLKKAIEAGSYNAAPSTLTNGAAYQTENLSSKQAKTGMEDHKFQGTKKKDWNKQAKDDYERWPHKEKFEKFMQARMPHLALGEIQALGRVLSLKKTIDGEKALDGLVKSTNASNPPSALHHTIDRDQSGSYYNVISHDPSLPQGSGGIGWSAKHGEKNIVGSHSSYTKAAAHYKQLTGKKHIRGQD